MPRVRRPTGRKPGRPTLLETVSEGLRKSKSHAAKGLLAKIEAHGKVPTGMLVLARDTVNDVAKALGQEPTHEPMNVPMVITGETPEERANSALTQTLERMHSKVLLALHEISTDDPKEFVRAWLELVQYKLPKLSKQDVSGTLNHQVSTFVPVEERRLEPIELSQMPDGTYDRPQG
jgi:hypothetical protein